MPSLSFPVIQIRLNDWKRVPERIRLEKLATEVSKCLERFIGVGRECFPGTEHPADVIRGKEVSVGERPDRE